MSPVFENVVLLDLPRGLLRPHPGDQQGHKCNKTNHQQIPCCQVLVGWTTVVAQPDGVVDISPIVVVSQVAPLS